MKLKILVTLALTLTLAGCVGVTKMETGERTIGDRLVLTLEGDWNQIDSPMIGPAKTWTMEGLPIDQLLVYSGIKNDQVVHAEAPGGGTAERKSFAFRSSMQPDQIVAMFEGMLTRDGSKFQLGKLEPMSFGGEKGFRFEYTVIRRADNVRLNGLGYGAVNKGELFAILYIAPRLTFFDRQKARVEALARGARIKT